MCIKHGRVLSNKRTVYDRLTYYRLLFLLLILLISFSRLICISHEMDNHPDERVFIYSSVSMSDVLLGKASSYSELKPYPQGSYFFYVPFQSIATLLELSVSARLVNRIGAVFYYIIGCITGLRLIQRFFKTRYSGILYVLLCTFSLFQIEQSRYGTGDPISFFLLMLSVYMATRGLDPLVIHAHRLIYISFILVGFAAAVKYPLVYFCLIPICTTLQKNRKNCLRCIGQLLIGFVLMLAGFLLLSPGIVEDTSYLIEVISRETNAYIYHGNLTEVGGTLNHILSVFFYWFLYSDIVFSPIFFFIAIRYFRKNCNDESESEIKFYFRVALPIILGGFLIYNLFVTTLFMRTLYPFFALILPYIAYGFSFLLTYKRKLSILLAGILVLRGSFLIIAMIPHSNQEHLNECVQQAIEISNGNQIIGLGLDTYVTGNGSQTIESLCYAENVEISDLRTAGFPEPQSGSVVVTGSLEFGKAAPYFVDTVHEDVNRLIDGWEAFKENYRNYYIGQSYPQYYGYLFGLWIKGTNLSEYDFPMNYVYAIP